MQHKLLRCRDLEEMRQVQAAFVQDAIDQYAEETGKMIDVAGLRAVEEG